MSMDFVPHLRFHSEYSLSHGLVRLAGENEIGKLAAERGIAAVAITDTNNIHAAVRHQQSCLRHGVKPILGCHAQFTRGGEISFVTLLCEDKAGYRNLCRLLSDAQVKTDGSLNASLLSSQQVAGLILLVGYESDVGLLLRRDKLDLASQALGWWLELFGAGNMAVELSFAGRAHEELISLQLAKMADELGVRAAAAHPVMFASEGDYEAHEMRVCIANAWRLDDAQRPHLNTQQQHFLSAAALRELYGDWPEALVNAQDIAMRCNFCLDTSATPQFAQIDPSQTNQRKVLEKVVAEGLRPIIVSLDEKAQQRYGERVAHELEVIIGKGFADYFLIVADLVSFAKGSSIPVGPGRGSGAGSLVAYALGITGIDPLEHGLVFERFLNPERSSLPDFDIDFCKNRRDEIIEHAKGKYGEDCVCQVVTFNTMKARAVVRDVSRALGKPYAVGDSLARLISDEINITLAQARSDSNELDEYIASEKLERAWDLALALEGLPRQGSTHASAVLIAPRPITEYCPVALVGDRSRSNPVSQFDMKAAESIGLIKFDILGLKNLTAIRAAEGMIKAIDAKFSIGEIDLTDQRAFKVYQEGNTVGVFQAESSGMVELIKKIKPVVLEDIAVAISLFRPGALNTGMDETYLDNRHRPEGISYEHPTLKKILSPTYGAMIYQEQPMLISRELAGFSLGRADTMREAIGKKDPKVMESLREDFVAGCEKELGRARAERLFSEIEKFAGYGFNKAHAVSYALISLQTAYLKTHHPCEFFAASLNTWADDTRTAEKLLQDAEANHVAIDLPSVNHSQVHHVAAGGRIRFGLSMIRGVGVALADSIARNRPDPGYQNLHDLCQRQGEGMLSQRALENLVKAGACDELVEGADSSKARAMLLPQIGGALESSAAARRNADQESLFGSEASTAPSTVKLTPLDRHQMLSSEFSTLGVTISGSFYDLLEDFARLSRKFTAIGDAKTVGRDNHLWAGYVLRKITHVRLRRENREVFILADKTSSIEVRVQRHRTDDHAIGSPGELVVAWGKVVAGQNNAIHIRAERVEPAGDWAAENLRGIRVCCDEQKKLPWLVESLARSEAGKSKIEIDLPYYEHPGVLVKPRKGFKVAPPLIGELCAKLGPDSLRLWF